ncbi:hypothetical protein Taro_045357, partial [Colocasia esculenta]|nr:hypothetical protein [Colocasia esculenta]
MALRRGNHTKAIRLMKEAAARHGSSALLHRVHGTVSVKVASLMDDPSAKLRHLRNAVESAHRAVELSPSSVEFAHFYANLLFEAATDGKGYEEVVQECERALSIPEPVDPARESLHQEESQQRLGSTPEARVSHIHQELRSLIQKANIASISSWVKNLNGAAVGMGEEKFRLIPIRRLSSPEDPMEVKLIQSARRPNEIKKATKTPEERRKEIEVRVAAARLLQHNPTPSSSHEDEPSPPSSSPSPSSSSSAQRLVERRKLMNARKLMSSADRMEQVKRYCNSIGPEKRCSFLEIVVSDLKQHFVATKDTVASDFLSEALSFAEANGMWKFWLCCKCGEKFANSDSHAQHVMHEHMGSLPPKLQCLLPQELDGEWVEMLVNGSWKPIDTSAALKMLEDEQLLKYQSLGQDNDSDDNGKDRDFLSDYWSSRNTSDSSASPQGDSSVDTVCNGLSEERKDNYIANSITGENSDNFHKWPLSDDAERIKLLERIHAMFELLLKYRCLGTTHLNKIVQFTMHELQGLPSGSHFLNQGLDQSPLCISFLDASQLRKVLKFLQDLSYSCGLARYSEKESLADDMVSAIQGSDFQEEIVLSRDLSKLVLDRHLFRSKSISNGLDDSGINDGTDMFDTNAFVTWLFAGPSTGEQLTAWAHLREEKFQQGTEILQALEKEFYLLQNACETKGEHLSYEAALQTIENCQVADAKRREHLTKLDTQNYEAFLRRRREELLKRENDMMSTSCRFELDAISNVLKDSQSLNLGHFGHDDMTSGLTPRLCELDAGDDGEWKTQDYLYQADACIEIAVQRQKEQLYLEVGKIDARILRHVNTMQLLENKLGPASSFDYCLMILPFVKSFMRSHLEDLVDKDAVEKSEAAKEAFLAELALDAKKNTNKAGDHLKQAQEKKDKRKSKEYRKSRDTKAFNSNEQALYSSQVEEKSVELLAATDTNQIQSELTTSDYLNGEEENRRRVELEAEERKLGEALEFQRRIEHEAKQRHLAEQCRKASATSSGSLGKVASNINMESACLENGLEEHHNERRLENGSLVNLRGDTESKNEISMERDSANEKCVSPVWMGGEASLVSPSPDTRPEGPAPPRVAVSRILRPNVSGDGEDLRRDIGGGRLSRGVASPDVGRAGGILILWNPFEVEEVEEDRQ